MIRFYRNALSRGVIFASYFTGLADLLLTEGGSEERREATAVLDRFVNRTAADAAAFRSALDVLDKHDLPGVTMRYRRMLLAIDPADYDNIFRLATAQIETGDRDGAIELLRRLFDERGVKKSLMVAAADPYSRLFEGRAAEAREEMSRYESRISDSEPHRLLAVYFALAANEMGRARELLDTIGTELYEPALLAREQAEFAQRTGNANGVIAWLQSSIRRDPVPANVLRLARALLANDRGEQALLLFDTYGWQGLSMGDAARIEQMSGLHGDDLLAFLDEMTSAALTAGAYETAGSYNDARLELATQLGRDAESRAEEIERMRQEHAPPEPPIKIVPDIANKIEGEDR